VVDVLEMISEDVGASSESKGDACRLLEQELFQFEFVFLLHVMKEFWQCHPSFQKLYSEETKISSMR
jgi:hypothetical protein